MNECKKTSGSRKERGWWGERKKKEKKVIFGPLLFDIQTPLIDWKPGIGRSRYSPYLLLYALLFVLSDKRTKAMHALFVAFSFLSISVLSNCLSITEIVFSSKAGSVKELCFAYIYFRYGCNFSTLHRCFYFKMKYHTNLLVEMKLNTAIVVA
jgi:hypothetical protein